MPTHNSNSQKKRQAIRDKFDTLVKLFNSSELILQFYISEQKLESVYFHNTPYSFSLNSQPIKNMNRGALYDLLQSVLNFHQETRDFANITAKTYRYSNSDKCIVESDVPTVDAVAMIKEKQATPMKPSHTNESSASPDISRLVPNSSSNASPTIHSVSNVHVVKTDAPTVDVLSMKNEKQATQMKPSLSKELRGEYDAFHVRTRYYIAVPFLFGVGSMLGIMGIIPASTFFVSLMTTAVLSFMLIQLISRQIQNHFSDWARKYPDQFRYQAKPTSYMSLVLQMIIFTAILCGISLLANPILPLFCVCMVSIGIIPTILIRRMHKGFKEHTKQSHLTTPENNLQKEHSSEFNSANPKRSDHLLHSKETLPVGCNLFPSPLNKPGSSEVVEKENRCNINSVN